ncbi:DUF2804 domain-containing protein [Desulfobotulus sp.]|jgi:hypothetical protein|uniref:DUF2804 domain-containing protein n=1 Tax=Desulfobotulus sp. TaxID=1940337 RepID=UPI002A37160B|nr:DUF2804 domain-containing protein [Desulfobotulus sp.]MDY0161959.1 DUF2804 domain-containing protein [Desulfobotulus sp.]
MVLSLICPETGRVRYGRYTGPCRINLKDFILKTPMGCTLPRSLLPLRYRQFVFFGVSDQDFSAGIALADLKYVQQAFFYAKPDAGPFWVRTLARSLFPPSPMDPESEFPDFSFNHGDFHLSFLNGTLRACCGNAHLEVQLEKEPPPLRLCTQTGYRGWTFTRKAAPITAHGHFRKGHFHRELLPFSCRVLTDRTCGLLRRETFWNWAAAASLLPDGRNFGMNLAWGVNETGFTENRIWLDDHPVDLGPVFFHVPENRSQDLWHIHNEDKSINLHFHPLGTLSQRFNAGLMATDFVQNTGRFTGRIHLPSLPALELSATPGWTEDHYVRW